MGIFRDSPEEKKLRDTINDVAELVGGVVSGTVAMQDLRDVVASKSNDLRVMYDAVAAKHGERTPKKILKESENIAIIWCGNASATAARRLMNDVLVGLNRAL